MTDSSAARPYMEIIVNGREMAGVIREVDVEDHDQLIDRARIVVQDPDSACANFSYEGQSVEIKVGWGSQHAVIFQGIVTRVEGQTSSTYPRSFTITALDYSYYMHLRRRLPRPHVGKLSKIIEGVVLEYKEHFAVGSIHVDNDVEFKSPNPLLQYNETDLQFIYRLANLYNARAFVEYNRIPGTDGGASKFYFYSARELMQGDRLTTLRYCQGVSEVLEFRVDRHSSDAEPQRRAVAVNPADGIPAEAITQQPPETGTPPPDIAAEVAHIEAQRRSAAGLRAAAEAYASAPVRRTDLRHHYDTAGIPSDPNNVDEVTRQDPTRFLGMRANGVAVGNVLIRAKGKIGITGFSVFDEGDWYVHKVNHKISQDRSARDRSYRTLFEVSR